MHSYAHVSADADGLLPVHASEDIAYLVMENEVLTGHAGRLFVIAGADWLIYRVQWQPLGLARSPVVERLGDDGHVLNSQHLQMREFMEHSLIEAQATGQLFTPPICQQG